MEADSILVLDHLPNVERVAFDAGLLVAQVEAAIERLGVRTLEPNNGEPRTFEIIDLCEMGPPSCVGCTGMPNCKPCPRAGVAQRPRRGFSIAVSKFDPAFEEKLGGGMFRYKHDEVLASILEVVRTTRGLAKEVHWDRGGGVFIYNLFLDDATA